MKSSKVSHRIRCLAALTAAAFTFGCADAASLMGPPIASQPSHGPAHGYFYITVQTEGDEDVSFSFTHNVGTNSSPAVANPFSVWSGGIRVFSNVVGATYNVTYTPHPDWELVAATNGYESACLDPTNNSDVDISTGVATINLSDGEEVLCAFVFRRKQDEPRPGDEPDPPGDQQVKPDPHGIGYWRNASSCTNGNQYTELVAGGEAHMTLDFYLPDDAAVFPLGAVTEVNCTQATNLLAKRDLNGFIKANDGAYNLVAQLFAARLNEAAQAPLPECVGTAMASAQTLLAELGFSGTGRYLEPKSKDARRATANGLANLLGRYNNNEAAVMGNNCG